jgi:hypothetical protein
MQNDQKVLQCLKNPPATGEIKSDGDSGSGRSGNYDAGWDRSLQQTYDSGYIVSGSINAKASPGHGSEDMWVVKLNPAGNIQWQKVLGEDG